MNRTFASQEEAYDLFNQYAKKKGFGIRKGSVKIKTNLKKVFCIVRFIAIELLIGAVLKKQKTECPDWQSGEHEGRKRSHFL